MLIALLAVLGVDLIVLVAFAALVFARKRWVERQPGSFRGVIRVASGEVDGLGSKWARGYGRWVSDVLVWTKAPLLFRNEVLATDGIGDQRPAHRDEVKRLGDDPVVVRIAMGSAAAQVAVRDDDRGLVVGPYRSSNDPQGDQG